MSDLSFISSPNLPSSSVKGVVVSSEYSAVIDALISLGIEPFPADGCAALPAPIANHADMVFSYLGDGKFIIEKNQIKLKQKLEALGMSCAGEIELKTGYPNDIMLNSCILGEHVICNAKNTHQKIVLNKKIIDVKQGYAKCSCAVIDEKSIITDDESIHRSALKNGLNALLVRKGDILLNGYEYGFIGGCCGKISPDTICFCGDIATHRDFDKISEFLTERNIRPISLFSGKLIDIGSIIPITEFS